MRPTFFCWRSVFCGPLWWKCCFLNLPVSFLYLQSTDLLSSLTWFFHFIWHCIYNNVLIQFLPSIIMWYLTTGSNQGLCISTSKYVLGTSFTDQNLEVPIFHLCSSVFPHFEAKRVLVKHSRFSCFTSSFCSIITTR